MTDETNRPADEFDDMDDQDIDLSPEELAIGEDIELITSYLNGHLDPERLEAVRKRLDEDETFRDLAAPLVMTWSIPKHIVRHPRPEGELERSWEEFKRRAGIDQPPPPPPPNHAVRVWRWWSGWRGFSSWQGKRVIILLVLGGLMVGAQLTYSSFAEHIDYRSMMISQQEYEEVPRDTGWISLGDGITVQLARGATLQRNKRLLLGETHVLLEGTARFRVSPLDSLSPTMRTDGIRVDTHAGNVTAGESEFSITANADTTVVTVHSSRRRHLVSFDSWLVSASVTLPDKTMTQPLRQFEGARIVRGTSVDLFIIR